MSVGKFLWRQSHTHTEDIAIPAPRPEHGAGKTGSLTTQGPRPRAGEAGPEWQRVWDRGRKGGGAAWAPQVCPEAANTKGPGVEGHLCPPAS